MNITVRPHCNIHANGHKYDKHQTPPISQYWKGNNALRQVKKPAANIITKFIKIYEEAWLAWLVGTCAVVTGTAVFLNNIGKWIQEYILPLFVVDTPMRNFLLLALFIAIFYWLIYMAGQMILIGARKLGVLIKDHIRR